MSLGKTSTPEFGSPCYTEPEGRPPAVTPWDTTRMAGGSSGGAAAAVAAGLVPAAQGSDGGGSIRIPASCCGLVGLKPTRGRISGFPMYGDPIGLATSGSIARTVGDAAALLDVLAGRRVSDPSWAPEPSGTFLEATRREPGRLRIARFVQPVIADVEVSAESRQAYDDASRLLADLGHFIEDVSVPLPPEAVATFETCWAVLTALSVTPLAARAARAAAAAHPLAGGAGRGGQRPRVRARDRPAAAVRRRRADRAGAVRRHPHAHPRHAAAARRRDPQRRRPGRRLRGAEAVHAVDVGLERHRDAGDLAAAALDGRRAAGRASCSRRGRPRRSCCCPWRPRSRPPSRGGIVVRRSGNAGRACGLFRGAPVVRGLM